MKTHKKCPTCQILKEARDFNKQGRNADGLQDQCRVCYHAYLAANRESLRIKNRIRYNRDQEKRIEANLSVKLESKFCSGCLLDKKVSEYSKSVNHKGGITPLCKGCSISSGAQIRKLNKEKNEYTLANELSWLSEDPLTVDHIVPLQGKNVSGLHVPWNLQILPSKKNTSKGNRHESDRQ
jgi:5-methylcytosine-specific restriction endonuclease McrA